MGASEKSTDSKNNDSRERERRLSFQWRGSCQGMYRFSNIFGVVEDDVGDVLVHCIFVLCMFAVTVHHHKKTSQISLYFPCIYIITYIY